MARPALSVSRNKIIHSLRSVARKLKRSPQKAEFLSLARITQHQFEKHFTAWNDALAEAKLAPNIPTAKSDAQLLEDWAKTVRKLGHCPSIHEYRSSGGKFGVGTFRGRFKAWREVRRAFYTHAAGDNKWQDVIKIIRKRESRCTKPWLITPNFRFDPGANSTTNSTGEVPVSCPIAYGEPIDYALLRNAPVNEQGVVFLFGCLAHRLGYIVDAIQASFPDCEAKRRYSDGRFRRVRIEFEHESRNFLLHQHDVKACDLIVCWRHNWPECPIRVIDLSVELEKLKKAAA